MDGSMTIAQTNRMTVLIADEGKKLYDGNTYSDKVYLGIFDSVDNWQEVDEESASEERSNEEARETYEELQSQMNLIREVYAE